MKTIQYNSDGGPISVTVQAGHAQTGSYEFRLWEADRNVIVMKREGDFLNPDNDTYELPTPNDVNEGRRIQAILVLALIPPIVQFSASMIVEQDGSVIGEIQLESQSNEPSVVINLYAILRAEGGA